METIEVDAGERELIRLGNGETFSNKVFDIRSNRSAATISAMARNWTIRNVAWRGPYGHNSRIIGCAETGSGTATIKNVYAADGVQQNMIVYRSGGQNIYDPSFGLWVSPHHSGTLNIEEMNVQGAIDNGFYASAPGSNANGQGGVVNFKNCYAKDNKISNFRTAGGKIENCVSVATESAHNPRPLWVWGTDNDGPVEVVNSDFMAGPFAWAMGIGRDGKTTRISARNVRQQGGVREHPGATVRWGTRDISGGPRDRYPDGCPRTWQEVFAENETPDMADYEHTLEMAGQFTYRIEVDEDLAPHEDVARFLPDSAYGDDWAEWYLTGSPRAETMWVFNGEITALEIEDYEGDIEIRRLRLDGEDTTVDDILGIDTPDDPIVEPIDGGIKVVRGGEIQTTYEVVWGDREPESDTYVRIAESPHVELPVDLQDEIEALVARADAHEERLDEKASRIDAIVDGIRSLAERV